MLSDAGIANREVKLLQAKRLALAEKLRGLKEQVESKKDEHAEDATQERVAALQSIDAVYIRHQTLLEQRQQLESQLKDAKVDLESLESFDPDEPKPYSFLLLESLHDQIAAEEERTSALTADLDSARHLLKAAHQDLDDWQEDRQVAAKGDKRDRTRDTSDQTEHETKGLLHRARVALQQSAIKVQELQIELSETRQKQLEKKLEVFDKDSAFDAQDRDLQLAKLAGMEAEAKHKRLQIEQCLQQSEVEQSAVMRKYRESEVPQPQVDAVNEAWRIARDSYQTEIVILDQRIEELVALRRFWKQRYEVASGHPPAKQLVEWKDEVTEFLEQLKNETKSIEHRRDAARGDEVGVGEPSEETNVHWGEFRNARLLELRNLCESRLGEIKSAQRALDRFDDELRDKLKSEPGDWSAELGDSLQTLVDYEVVDADDESVTVGRLVILSLYILGGLLLAYALSRLIGGRMLTRLGLHPGTTTALRSILFYALCVFFGILAFQLLRIPLGAFAFLGGAAAIAIGFGSQDIMNNFMSGIILLMEQPIRVGDVIELSGTQGQVTHIGLRSTRMLTEANHELIVANSTLLEKQVTNLTLSDEFVRNVVTLELDRAEDMEAIKRRMLEAAFSHSMVMKSPRPVVLLKEVDCYSMRFEVHFWLEHRSFMKCAMVQSEIMEAVTISFPPEDEAGVRIPPADGDANGSQESAEAPSTQGSATPTPRKMLAALRHMSNAAMAKELRRSGHHAAPNGK